MATLIGWATQALTRVASSVTSVRQNDPHPYTIYLTTLMHSFQITPICDYDSALQRNLPDITTIPRNFPHFTAFCRISTQYPMFNSESLPNVFSLQPFSGAEVDQPTVVVQQQSSRRPDAKNRSKKKGGNKGRVTKAGAADGDPSAASRSTKDVDGTSPARSSTSFCDTEGGRELKASSSAETVAASPADAKAEAEAQAEARAQAEAEAEAAAAAAAAAEAEAEEERKRRSKMKSWRSRERAKVKKQFLQNSVVKELPEDVVEKERRALKAKIISALKELPAMESMTFPEAQGALPDRLATMDTLVADTDKAVRLMANRTPKLPLGFDRNTTIEEFRASIQALELEGLKTAEANSTSPASNAHSQSQTQAQTLSKPSDSFDSAAGQSNSTQSNSNHTDSTAKTASPGLSSVSGSVKGLSELKSSEILSRKVNELSILISIANQHKWATEMADLKTEILAAKREDQRSLAVVRDRDLKKRALERLAALVPEGEECLLTAETLCQKPLEISPVVAAVFFAPVHAARRLERLYNVAIDSAPSTATSGVGAGGASRKRQMLISGLEENIDAFLSFVAAADWTGKYSRAYDKALMPAIIGRGRSNLNNLEAQTRAPIHILEDTTIVVYGTEAAASEVFQALAKLKTERAQQLTATKEIETDLIVARALNAHYKPLLLALEQQHGARFTVIFGSSNAGANPTSLSTIIGSTELEGGSGSGRISSPSRIIVRAPPAALEAAVEGLKKQVLDTLQRLEFPCTARAFSRLVVNRAGGSSASAGGAVGRRAAEAAELNREYKFLQETFTLIVERRVARGGPAGDAYDPDLDVGMIVLCRAKDAAALEARISDLIERADYRTLRVPISRQQARIFTVDQRGLLEANHGVRLTVFVRPKADTGATASSENIGGSGRGSGNDDGAAVNLVGPAKAVLAAEAAVKELLSRSGCVKAVKFEDEQVMRSLLRNRAEMLRDLEREFDVSISLSLENREANVVGDTEAVERFVAKVKELEAENASRRRPNTARSGEAGGAESSSGELSGDMEGSTLCVEIVEIRTALIPMLIGRGGATINNIRQESGIDVIDIPRSRSAAGARAGASAGATITTKITLKGSEEAVAKAAKMIDNIVNADSAFNPRMGRGDGDLAGAFSPTVLPVSAEHTRVLADGPALGVGTRGQANAARRGLDNVSDETSFPTIETSLRRVVGRHPLAAGEPDLF